MKYALLIYSPAGEVLGLDPELTAEYMALTEDPRCLGGGQLQPVETATTIRVRGGEALATDGPFADTKEVFGGYYIFDVDDLDAATELAARVPMARQGGSVEVRPLVER
jgi:hypothetical protein